MAGPGAFGTLGVSAGFAIALVYPNRPVWILMGMVVLDILMEFDTFQRHGLGITALIGNDACWTQIARIRWSFGFRLCGDVGPSDYDKIH